MRPWGGARGLHIPDTGQTLRVLAWVAYGLLAILWLSFYLPALACAWCGTWVQARYDLPRFSLTRLPGGDRMGT
jgi:hypothetical protein